MSANGVAQVVVFLLVVTALTPVVGAYIFRVLENQRIPGVSRVLGPIERGTLRLLRVDPAREQGWKAYAGAVLAFSVASFALLYAILRPQGHLPLNPADYPGHELVRRFNTAISFVTNTNWQYFARRVDAVLLQPDDRPRGAELRLGGGRHRRHGGRRARLRPARHRGARQLLGRPRAHHAVRAGAASRSCSAWSRLAGRHPDLRRPDHLPDPRGAHDRRHRRRRPAGHAASTAGRSPRRSRSSSSAPTAAATTTSTRPSRSRTRRRSRTSSRSF